MRLLKLKDLSLIIAIQFLFLMNGMAQYKSYKISIKKDTINIVDKNGLKQGKWLIHVDELRGEPGYEMEGVFKDDKKEGIWRQYNLASDIISVENYLHGGKDGIQQYYTYLGDLHRQESWRGYNPDAPYDTVAVYGTGSNEIVSYKIVKAEQYSVKHGEWKYFDPQTGRVIKIEKYERGFLEGSSAGQTKASVTDKNKTKKPDKTPEMLEWEKKNKGKKRVVRDGRTSGG